MDSSFLVMLSNLLNIQQNHIDPTSSSDPNPASSESSAAPLLFFAVASVISYVSSRRTSSPRPPPSNPNSSSNSSAAAFFHSLSSDRIWSMDPAARDARFRSLYGVSYPVFATLLDHLRPHPLPLPADRALPLALSRLSRGLSSSSLARSLSLPPSLVSRSTHAVTRILSTRLYHDYVKPPTSHRLLSSLQSFNHLTSLPNLSASIASSPIRLRRHHDDNNDPHHLRSPNRPFPSVLLQAVADTRRVFWDACVRAPGSSDPASHLRDSALYDRLCSSEILRDPVVTVRGHHVRPYLAGDRSYPLLPFLLAPFAGSPDRSGSASPEREAFDSALAKGRAASVESAVALLKGRWKILRNLNVGLDHVAQTVVACVVLHNMCQIAGEPEDEGRYRWRDPPEAPQTAEPLDSERSMYYFGESLRQALADDLYERQQRESGGAGVR